jgi:adenylate cyclase
MRRMGGWTIVAVGCFSVYPSIHLSAQCPDGSPPPCGSARGAVAGPPARSVAVLYFESLSRDTADAYIADGFTEEITGRLGQIERLSVTSRTAARRLRNATTLSTVDIGRALNARFLVNGTVRRSEERLRVTVELVRAATGARVWGDQYDRSAEDLLAIESEVARAVATGIAGQLLPGEAAKLATRPTPSPLAYDHYLRGNQLLWRQDEHSVLRAIDEYEAALAVDSAFTAARGRLADAYGRALNWSFTPGRLSRDSIFARGLAAAERAVHEDSMSAEAWLGRGRVQSFGGRRGDLDSAVVSGQRAVALDPRNDAAHNFLGSALRRVGRFAEGKREYQRARTINPYQVQATADLGFLAYSLRHFAEAVQWYDNAVALDTTFSFTFALRARARAESGDLTGALNDAATALRVALPNEVFRSSAELAEMESRNGQAERARQRLEEAFLATGWRDGIPDTMVTVRNVYDPALAAVALGMPDVAIGILERATPRGPWLWSYLIWTGFDPLRNNPRFIRIFEESKPSNAPEVPR